MRLRGFAVKTVEAYIYALEQLWRFYRRPLETLSCAEVQRFLDEIITVRKLAWATVNVYFSAYRFLYEQVLKRSKRDFSIPPRGRSGKRPGVLSRDEVERLIAAPHSLKHRALLAMVYGSGLRVSEVVRVRTRTGRRPEMDARTHLRVADVFREGWKAYFGALRVPHRLAQVARHIMACRTAALGGHLHRCDACGAEVPVYNSCRDRHCPTCQTLRKQRWLEQRRAEVLPVPYFHVDFTLPHALNGLITANRARLLGELFGTVNWVLSHFAADPQWKLCVQIGFIAVLHTWTQRLTAHYHLHCLVPGGAWNAEEGVWRCAHSRFIFGKDALASAFRARFIRRLWDTKWIVYPKATAKNPEQALDYLGRYTHRVAISDHRIRTIANGNVTFTWRDRADGNTEKEMTLPLGDFIGRFLLHILPSGFQKVRAYGWLASRNKRDALAAIRKAIGAQPPPRPPEGETVPECILRLTGIDITCCPICGKGHLVCVAELHRARDGPT